MSSRTLKESEIESALEEMFGLPSDPDQSEDDEESDEDNNCLVAPILVQFKLQEDREVDMRWVRKVEEKIGQRRRAEKSRDHGDSGSESEVDSETNASDEDENAWKKKLWTDKRPQPDTFNSVLMTSTRMLPSNARPVRHFEKFFTQEIVELIIRETN
ncbi:unnamed protein product [Parnassius apollo]|uniref:(apollo) hypothetical protein n=1 Tax=Parnassius apollo TaxID=110799 RepID=A0A8S3XDJ0_PARAO|nr:unnamed protein product [Parnassius apollo]